MDGAICNKHIRLFPKDEAPSSISFSITDLPDVLLQTCLSFVGPGHYRLFVAGTCHRFQDNYNFPVQTTWENAATSVSCATFCVHDHTLTESMSSVVLEELTHRAAYMGNVKVLQWALHEQSYAICVRGLIAAGRNGHVNVLE